MRRSLASDQPLFRARADSNLAITEWTLLAGVHIVLTPDMIDNDHALNDWLLSAVLDLGTVVWHDPIPSG
jgi:hypothetical protein